MDLVGVSIASATPEEIVDTYLAICGPGQAIEPTADALRIALGDAELVFRPSSDLRGVSGVTVLRDPPTGAGETRVAPGTRTLNGIEVRFSRSTSPPSAPPRGARLDHVAVCVGDLEAATGQWERLLGVEAQRLGVHPVSNGAFTASRLLLNQRMIELVSPVPGVASPLADRLAKHGEGAVTLALPVADLGAALERLRILGVRVLEQPPHWMVHPQHTGGVLVQLTPRIQH